MKTVITIGRDTPDADEPTLYGLVHDAVRLIRPDLYTNGKRPRLQVRNGNGHEPGVTSIQESDNEITILTKNVWEVLIPIRNLKAGRAVVGELDTVRQPVSTLTTEGAVRRPRKLGRWD
jgi:hypothetical protein